MSILLVFSVSWYMSIFHVFSVSWYMSIFLVFSVSWYMNIFLVFSVSWSEMFILGGWDSSIVRRLNVSDEKIDHLPDGPALPYSRELYLASVVESKGQLILTGGLLRRQDIEHVQNGTYIFDTNQSPATWVPGPKLLTARDDHFSFVLAGQIFVGCGLDQGSNYLSNLEMNTFTNGQAHWKYVKEDYPIAVNFSHSPR